MACHLAGVPTAVATCGTAFGDEHARVLRRFLHDHEEFRGEVIFTFDGDAAGQKAALRAFARRPELRLPDLRRRRADGLDPCDLRIQQGDAAVRELVARRVPLYRFVLGNVVGKYDLDRADGRVDAVREAARLVSSHPRPVEGRRVLPRARRDGRRRHRRRPRGGGAPGASQPVPTSAGPAAPRPAPEEQPARAAQPLPDLRDPRFAHRARDAQAGRSSTPMPIGRTTADVGANDFTHPTYRAVWELVDAAGGPAAGADDRSWAAELRDAATDPAVAVGDQRARRRAAADRQGARRGVRRRCTSTGCSELTALRRIAERQVAAAAHQPGRARRPSTTGCSASWSPSSSTAARCASWPWART